MGRDSTSGGRCQALHEGEHSAPGVVAGVLVFGVSPVEEAVRRARVGVRLDRDAPGADLAGDLLELLWGRGIGAGQQEEELALHLRNQRENPLRAAAVEADRTGQA